MFPDLSFLRRVSFVRTGRALPTAGLLLATLASPAYAKAGDEKLSNDLKTVTSDPAIVGER